jgi:hypothetical protein
MAADQKEVLLVSAPDCHLCERAMAVLTRLSKEPVRELSWSSEEGHLLVSRDGVPFPPAVYIDGSLAAYGRLSERGLRRKLEKRSP